MKRAWVVMAAALVVSLMIAPVAMAQTKWVRGEVTAVAADNITVTVQGSTMVFKVETSTVVIARGGSTATRKEQAAGKAGPMLGTFVKPGQHVEVRYKESGATMVATEIRLIATEDQSMSNQTGKGSLSGTIVMIGADSLTVKGDDGKDVKFTVNPKTQVIGRGVGTKAGQLEKAGKPATITEFLGANDKVIVYFDEAGGVMTAKDVRLVQKAMK